jgi:hypothetical protein
MNKDVRNAFVELSLGELGRDIPRLLDYCAADVRATLQATLCSWRWNSRTAFLVQVSSHNVAGDGIHERHTLVRVSWHKLESSPVWRIRDVYTGSRIRLFSIPDPNCLHPRSRILIKEFKYFNPKKAKKWFLSSKKYDPGCSSRIRMLTFSHPGSRIQGSKRNPIPDPDPQHWSSQARVFVCFVCIFKIRVL